MILDEVSLNNLEILIEGLFEDKMDYEIKDYVIDKTISKSKELKNLLSKVFSKIKKRSIYDLEFIDSLNVSYTTKKVLKRFLYKFRTSLFAERDDILDEYSSYKLYYDDIKDLQLFTDEKEERELFLEYQKTKSKAIYNEILERSLRFVPYYIRKWLSKKDDDIELDFMDLVQEGNLGVMHAIEKYDLNKGLRFNSYAKYWIKHRVTKAIINQSRAIKLSYIGNYALNNIDNIETSGDKVIIGNYCINKQTLENYKMFKNQLTSLQDIVSNDLGEEVELIDTLIDNKISFEDEFEKKELIKQMISEIEDERLREIILLRYGFNNNKIYSGMEIAQKKGLTRQRIGQLEKRALEELEKTKIKKMLEENNYGK